MENRSLRKPLAVVAGVTGLLLLIPLAAMQFTSEMQWGPEDFVLAACLLFATGLGIVLVLRHARRTAHRVVLVALLGCALALVWAELAVGLFS